MPNRRFGVQKESPDVETPGLLVKALISSYFEEDFTPLSVFLYKYIVINHFTKFFPIP